MCANDEYVAFHTGVTLIYTNNNKGTSIAPKSLETTLRGAPRVGQFQNRSAAFKLSTEGLTRQGGLVEKARYVVLNDAGIV